MTCRFTLPNGNSHTSFVVQSVKVFPKGVVLMDARGKLLDFVPVTDKEKAERVQYIINQALKSNRRHIDPDWSFLQEAPMPAAVEVQGKDGKQESKK